MCNIVCLQLLIFFHIILLVLLVFLFLVLLEVLNFIVLILILIVVLLPILSRLLVLMVLIRGTILLKHMLELVENMLSEEVCVHFLFIFDLIIDLLLLLGLLLLRAQVADVQGVVPVENGEDVGDILVPRVTLNLKLK